MGENARVTSNTIASTREISAQHGRKPQGKGREAGRAGGDARMTWSAAWDAMEIGTGIWEEATNADGQRVIRVRWEPASGEGQVTGETHDTGHEQQGGRQDTGAGARQVETDRQE